VEEKRVGNFCEFFDFVRRPYVPTSSLNPREAAARNQLKRLLGD
jgi:hypothetical protein